MPVMTLTLLILTTVILLMGSRIAVALGLASTFVMIIYRPVGSLQIIPQLFSEASTSFILLAVPLFILAGNLMERGTIGRNLIDFTSSIVGWMKGGLGAVNIVGSMLFGGISGSSLADTATFGTILIPRMVEEKYPKKYAAAVTLTSSCLSVVIPPSILIVLAAASTLQSVSKALAAGLVPGLLITTLLLVPNYYISSKHGYGKGIKFSIKNIISKFSTCWTALVAPLIILGCIFSGIVTPTEGALVAVIYILIIDVLVYKKLNLKDFIKCLEKTAVLTSSILFIATSSAIANWIIAYENVPKYIATQLTNVPGGKYGFLILMVIILVIIGMILDASPAILIFAPLFLPIAVSMGVEPVHFLTIMITALAVGLTTPPYGVCLFSISSISKVPMDELIKSSIPFYAMLIIGLLLITFIPQITLAVPKLLGL